MRLSHFLKVCSWNRVEIAPCSDSDMLFFLSASPAIDSKVCMSILSLWVIIQRRNWWMNTQLHNFFIKTLEEEFFQRHGIKIRLSIYLSSICHHHHLSVIYILLILFLWRSLTNGKEKIRETWELKYFQLFLS